MKLQHLTLRMIQLPLIQPYVLSYRTFTEFEPIIVEVRDADGRIGWGEGHISPGSSSETREGGWEFCREHAAAAVGKDTVRAKAMIAANLNASKVAATALLTAIEMLEDHPLLRSEREVRLPLLTPFNSSTPKEIEEEVERRLSDGFRTFKIKVGKDADAKRVKAIQHAIAGRATMRIDANRAYGRPTPAALPRPSIPPASSCLNSHAIPTIGTRTPVSRKYPPFPLCWMSRFAGSMISSAPPIFPMLDSASSSLSGSAALTHSSKPWRGSGSLAWSLSLG